MSKANNTKAIFGLPGTLTIAGQTFVIPSPTAGDLARLADRMRELAMPGMANPLMAVNAVATEMHAGVASEAIRHAVAMAAGGGVEPTREAVMRQYQSLAGLRFQVWYFVRKTVPGFTQKQAEELVTEENRYDVADGLIDAQQLPEDAGPKAPLSGASS